MSDRHRFIDVPPPDVVWTVVGEADADEALLPRGELQVGQRIGTGVVVLPGDAGQPAERRDTHDRAVLAVPQVCHDDAETAATPLQTPIEPNDVTPRDLDAWLERLAMAGVRPDRVNCPDLHAQLAASKTRPAELVLCSCVEPDPLLPLQAEWALRHPRAFSDGLRILARLSGARRSVVAVASGDHRRLSRHMAHLDPHTPAPTTGDESPTVDVGSVRLMSVNNAYPQADPTLMAYALAGKRLPPGASPLDVGVLVVDAVAAVAVGQVARGCACVRTEPIGLRDHRTGLGVLANVWRGSRLCDVLLFLGLQHHDCERDDKGEPIRICGGDFLRGNGLDPAAIVGNGELIFHIEAATPTAPPEPCIRCGWCLDICPTGLNPAGLLDAEAAKPDKRHQLAIRHGADACIGCGLCDYACPSSLPLRDVATKMRDFIKASASPVSAEGDPETPQDALP